MGHNWDRAKNHIVYKVEPMILYKTYIATITPNSDVASYPKSNFLYSRFPRLPVKAHLKTIEWL
jgi:hypothetical protein